MASNTQARQVADGGLLRRMDGVVESEEKLHDVLPTVTRGCRLRVTGTRTRHQARDPSEEANTC